jgi:hypothetical protein
MLCHSFIRGTFVDGLTKIQKNHVFGGVGNFRLGIAANITNIELIPGIDAAIL